MEACTGTAGGIKTVINSNEEATICHHNCKCCKPRHVLLVIVVVLVIAVIAIVVEDATSASDVDIDFLYNTDVFVVKAAGVEVFIIVDTSVDTNVGVAVAAFSGTQQLVAFTFFTTFIVGIIVAVVVAAVVVSVKEVAIRITSCSELMLLFSVMILFQV